MNKNIRVFAFPAVGIVLFLIIALFCTACSHTESYQETTMDFYAAKFCRRHKQRCRILLKQTTIPC